MVFYFLQNNSSITYKCDKQDIDLLLVPKRYLL